MSVGPNEYLPDPAIAAPLWLSEFVRDEVRPMLLRTRHIALEAVSRWLVWHEKRVQERALLESRYESRWAEYRRLQSELTPGEPAPPWPDEPNEDTWPDVEYPIPLPVNRDLSSDEAWLVLVAIHDVARDRAESIGPRDSRPFYILKTHHMWQLQREDLPQIRRIMTEMPAVAPLPVGSAHPNSLDGKSSETRVDPESLAIALVMKHPNWTIAQIASKVGVDRRTLYKWPKFRNAAKASGVLKPRGAKDQDLRRGQRTPDGQIEAWDDEDE
jgi:hypothetical protein